MSLRQLSVLVGFVVLFSANSVHPQQSTVTISFADSFTEVQLAPNIFKIAFTGDIGEFLHATPAAAQEPRRGALSKIGNFLGAFTGSTARFAAIRAEEREQEKRELVNAKGMQTVIDLTLLRSAEVALESKFKYFVVVNSETWDRATTTTTPAEATTKIQQKGVLLRRDKAVTTVTQGETRTTLNPSASKTILCYTEKPEGIEAVYDAEFVANSIRKSYNITNWN